MEKKILVIYPQSTVHIDTCFYLIDPDTGEVLATHICSGAEWAKRDLHDERPQRLEKLKNKFGKDTKLNL